MNDQKEPTLPRRETAAPMRALLSLLSRMTSAASATGTLMILGLMVLINADVGGRYLFNSPVPGTAEVIAASIVTIIFLQLPDCIREGRMIQTDMWVSRLRQKYPTFGVVLEIMFGVLSTLMLATLVYYLVPATSKAFYAHHTIGVPGMFTAPIWPFYVLVLLGAILATFEYARATAETFVGRRPIPTSTEIA